MTTTAPTLLTAEEFEDELVFDDVLPGFRCRAGDFFRRPGQSSPDAA